jgi:hypothetical protein
MNVPNFKNLIRKLSALKNNLSLLVPIIIAVVALLLFVPTRLVSSKLSKQIAGESVAKADRLKTIKAIPRQQWKIQQQYEQAYQNDANEIARLAKQTTQRQLLSYRIFPKPEGTSAFIFEDFGEQFRKGVEGLMAGMKAGDCPTTTELDRALQAAPTRRRSGSRRPGSTYPSARSASPQRTPLGTSSPIRGPYTRGSYWRMSEIDSTIIDEICRAKAEGALVYAHQTDVSGYEFWGAYEYAGLDQAVKDSWYWQLGYWIVEDVVDTIDAMSAQSQNVFTSPVKRLMRVSFSLSARRTGMTGRLRRPGMTVQRGRDRVADDKPSYVLSARDGLTQPCTGRYCSDEDKLDVMHFNVTVLIRADAVLPFMQELCSAKEHKFSGYLQREPEQTFKHNQITILESNVTTIDTESPDHDLFRYGDDAVVELDLICEYIFNRTGYEEIFPEVVKESMKQEDETKRGRRR